MHRIRENREALENVWDKIKKFLKSKTAKIAMIILACYLVIVLAGIIVVDGRYVRFYMSGQQEMTLEYGSEYEDPGIYAVTNGKVFGESSRKLKLETIGAIDS